MSKPEPSKLQAGSVVQSTGLSTENTLKPFSLTRWFATVGLLSILALAVIGALLLSRLFAERMLLQEGRLTMQFVQGVIDVEGAATYFQSEIADRANYLEGLMADIAGSPDVLRTNLYSRQRTIIWSSDPSMSGKSFAGSRNPQLDSALAGKLEIHEEMGEEEPGQKAEHANLRSDADDFIELYVPVWDRSRQNVVGAVELYRAPRLLRDAIDSGVRMIWAGAIGAGLVLYLALLPLVRRADFMIRSQQDRIVEAETVAAMGDLGSAVAHGVRNPLAVIRSSAEIAREGRNPDVIREAVSDIIGQVDRLEHWVRELLTYVHLPKGATEPIDLAALARASMNNFSAEMRRRGIVGQCEFKGELLPVQGDSMLLGQVLNSLIANAVEAMPQGGRLTIDGMVGAAGILLMHVRDTGSGMNDEQLGRAFKPFHTTKSQGLGVGLPLAKRIVERMGGGIAIASRPGNGTTVELALSAVRK